MPKRPAFPSLRDAMEKKRTPRELFLSEMDALVPWGRLLSLIEPHYPKAGPQGGRPPMPLDTMLRVYFLQNWYALSDPMAEETLYDSEAMRRFARNGLGDDRSPDETTILNFRHLLERHGLTQAIFADVNEHLADKGYVRAERKAAFKAPGKVWGVMRKAPKGSKLHPVDERIDRIIAKVRAKVQHPFLIIKRQFGHVKIRYRGLAKNRAHLFTLFALSHLFLVRRRLMA